MKKARKNMDAFEFLEERHRMCKSNPMGEYNCRACDGFSEREDECMVYSDDADYFSSAVKIVEQWSKSHPKKTRKDDFFEKHQNSPKSKSGNPKVCAIYLGYCKTCEHSECDGCTNCWKEPLE